MLRSHTLPSLACSALIALTLCSTHADDTAAPKTVTPSGDGVTTPIKITSPRVQPGQTIRTTIVTTAEGGSFKASGGDDSTGTISLHRVRTFDQAIKSIDKFGRITAFTLTVTRDVTLTEVTIDGKITKNSSTNPLVGIRMVSVGDPGQWSLVPASGTFTDEQMVAVVPLIGFQNQQWMPQVPIKTGDEWEYDPAYFRHLVGADLGSVFSKGVMRFDEVIDAEKGDRLAHISMKTSTKGTAGDNGSTTREASIQGQGSLVINLNNMLDRTSTIQGELIAGAQDGDQKGAATLPFKIDMKRQIIDAN